MSHKDIVRWRMEDPITLGLDVRRTGRHDQVFSALALVRPSKSGIGGRPFVQKSSTPSALAVTWAGAMAPSNAAPAVSSDKPDSQLDTHGSPFYFSGVGGVAFLTLERVGVGFSRDTFQDWPFGGLALEVVIPAFSASSINAFANFSPMASASWAAITLLTLFAFKKLTIS